MDDLISRQAAIEALDRIFDRCEEIEAHLPEGDPDRTGYKMYPDYMTVWKYLRQLPSAQPERKKGSWNVIQGNIVVCSECGMLAPKSMTGCLLNRHLEPNRTNFCPNCGADMRGEQNESV